MKACPELVEWEGLATDRLADPSARPLRAHLGGCAECRALFENIRRNERLLAPLRGVLNGHIPTVEPFEAVIGRQIGRYRVEGVLAHGGMAVVYRATQEQPHRTVALKLIRPGLASRSALRRFEHEAELLGRLHHPGIAQIFEAGLYAPDPSDPSGMVPFFAMELIQGRRLTDYAGEQRLGTRPRLDLFAKVCDAVQHAHQKGIIHRDLKPSNILVDEHGQPKVLDFGAARATDSDIQSTTLGTDVGQLIGTIPYMSPEQASGDPDELDTRSDIYALGVVCYELLAGRLPYDLQRRTIPEAVRIIREEDATPLSSINRMFRGDVETIVSRALEKDKARRYPSASALAADIRRYLNDEPITARPPSAVYQLRKFARRNRALATGMAVAFTGLLLSIAMLVGAFLRVTAKNQEVIAAQRERLEAAERRRRAEVPFVRAMDFIRRRVLPDQAITLLDEALRIDPAFAAAHFERGGLKYDRDNKRPNAERLFSIDEIIADLETAHERAESAGMSRALVKIGFILVDRNQPDKAAQYFQRAAVLDPDDVYARVGAAMAQVGKRENVDHVIGVLEKLAHDPIASQLAEVWYRLGLAYQGTYYHYYKGYNPRSDPVKAETALRRALELDPDDGRIWDAIGAAQYNQGKKGEALVSFERAFALCPDRAIAWMNIAVIRRDSKDWPGVLEAAEAAIERDTQGKLYSAWLDKANALYRLDRFEEALEASRRAVAIDPGFFDSWYWLGICLRELDKFQEAEGAMRQAIHLHPKYPPSWHGLGSVLWIGGRREEAIAALEHCLDLDPNNARWCEQLAEERDFVKAEATCRKELNQLRASLPPDHPRIADSLETLGCLLLDCDYPAEAEPFLRECAEIRRRSLPQGAWRVHVATSAWGSALAQLQRFENAQAQLLSGYEGIVAARGETDPESQKAAERIVALYDARHDAESDKGYDQKAAEWREKLKAWQATTLPATSTSISHTTNASSPPPATQPAGREAQTRSRQ